MNVITVQVHRDDANYAQIAANDGGIIITWLVIGVGKREIVRGEALTFAEYPDLRNIHDGRGWNATEVANLITSVILRTEVR